MLWLRIFLLFLRTNLILFFGLITTLQATVAQISRDQFLHVLSNALEHDWDFETDRIDIEIKKVELESSREKYVGLKLDLEMTHKIEDWERWRTTTSTAPYTRKQEAKNYQLKTSSIQDYIQSIENEFEAYHSQLKAKVDFQKELLKYDDLLDRLLLEKNQSP